MLNYNKKYNGFKSWTDYLLNNPTEPVQYFDPYMLAICAESNKLKLNNETSIQFHQRMLGKQKFIWIGSEKNYIWQFDKFLLFVAKNKGRSLEVFCSLIDDLTDQDYKNILNIYIKSVGITLSLENLHLSKYDFKL